MSEKAMSFNGEAAVSVYGMAVLASGLRLYARTGMRPNRMWTPKAMLTAAQQITGQTFKGKAKYTDAADAVTAVMDAEKAKLTRTETEHHISFTAPE